jgi:hypothetical protein
VKNKVGKSLLTLAVDGFLNGLILVISVSGLSKPYLITLPMCSQLKAHSFEIANLLV